VSDRILTTHVGALQRTPEAEAALLGEAPADELTAAVAEVVRRQVEAGVDIVDDGEYGKSIWQWYVTERLDGIDRKEREGLAPLRGRDHLEFPDFYAYALATPDVLFHGSDRAFWNAIATVPVCVGPIGYKPGPVERDIANLKAALDGAGVVDAFMPAVAPASAEVDMGNEHYATQEELLWALADALREEYRAIVDAGFVLQVDDPRLVTYYMMNPGVSVKDCRTWVAQRVDAINHALRGIPREQVRFHTCYSIDVGPRIYDMELKDIVDILYRINAGAFSFEAANPRHEHEYHVFEQFRPPDGLILIPGVISHTTNLVEHPELIA
jgi:5-methyltetrahydropteroyltriglutamate--homocysteine methyltransferase